MNAPATQQAKGTDPQQLINNISSTYSSIEKGDWVQAGLGIANTAMDIVGMASNPLSGFLSAGFSWAMNHVDFLREPFDMLLGNPEAIGKMAQSFRSAGQQVHGIATEYKKICVEQTREWGGKAADGYRAAAQKHAGGLESLSKAAHGIAGAVEGAGQLVGTVRKMIMDMISQAVSDMVMKIIQWLAASFLTFGAAIAGAIADIVTTAVKYAKKLADFLQKLASSLQKLMKLVKSVQQIAQMAEQIINAISAMAHKGAGGGGMSRPTAGGLGITEGQLDRATGGANGTYSHDQGGYRGGAGGGGGGPQVRDVYDPGAVTGGQGGGATGTSGAGPTVRPVYTPPGQGQGGGGGYLPPGHTDADHHLPGSGHTDADHHRPPGGGSGSGSGGYVPPGSPGLPGGPGSPGSGQGRWVPGHWEVDTTTAAGGNTGTKPPSIGTIPTTPGTSDWYRPTATEHTSAAGGGGGGIPKGGGGGGGGGIPAGAFGGGAGGGGTGASTAMQHGGAAGVMPTAAAGAAAAGGAHGPSGGGGGGAAGGMMGGAPMGAAGGQQGGGANEHKRKVRIDGEPLVDPPKAAKPVIGE